MQITGEILLGALAVAVGWGTASAVDGSRPDAEVRAELAAEPAPPAPTRTALPFFYAVVPARPPAPSKGEKLGRFFMTRYYVAEEAVLASAVPSGGVTIYSKRGCRPLAQLTAGFVEVLDIQGTGKLLDGRVVNVSGHCDCPHSPCYRVMSERARWGMSASGRPLQPFRTVAVDPKVVKLGTVLYIAELDGMTMPGEAPHGGFVHDGCVRASDVGGGIDGMQVDWFVGRRAYKKALDRRGKTKHVTVYRGAERCKRPGASNARGAGI
jgi:3D (Asp-Asp-Asp) domain-containing protein